MFGGKTLRVVRWCFYVGAFVILSVTAVIVLAIDLRVDDDPVVRAYHYIRWMFITCWFNLMLLAYYPLCMYCDWLQMGTETRPLKVLKGIRDVAMTSILFPTVMMADLVFWVCFYADAEFIAPSKLYVYLPIWAQHSMHTLSIFTVTFDLIVTPRRRPRSYLPRLGVMTAFFLTYDLVVYISQQHGVYIYSFLRFVKGYQLLVFLSCVYLGYLFFFYIQWCIIDYCWRNNAEIKKVE